MAEFYKLPEGTAEQLLQLVMQLVSKAAERGHSEIQVYRFPNAFAAIAADGSTTRSPIATLPCRVVPSSPTNSGASTSGPIGFHLRVEVLEYPRGCPADGKSDKPETPGKLKWKEYERELARQHVEFVKLQHWVVHTGLQVCIVFEGRDGVRKGGTIKAITERVSPCVFRVVALSALTERENPQMNAQRYMRHLPAAAEVVIVDRSWTTALASSALWAFAPKSRQDASWKPFPCTRKPSSNLELFF
jgi:hypothetical protein